MNLPFKIKEILAGALAGLIPILAFVLIGFYTKNLTLGLVGGLISVGVSVFTTELLLREPLTRAIKGEGILVHDLNGTGNIQQYLCKIKGREMEIGLGKRKFTNIFDRNLLHYLKPAKTGKVTITNENNINFTLTDEQFQDALFKSKGIPMIYYNSKTGLVLTKEVLNNMENSLLVETIALTQLEQVKQLRFELKVLAKIVADEFSSKIWDFLSHPIVKVIIFVMIVIGVIIFLGPLVPKLMESYVTNGATGSGLVVGR